MELAQGSDAANFGGSTQPFHFEGLAVKKFCTLYHAHSLYLYSKRKHADLQNANITFICKLFSNSTYNWHKVMRLISVVIRNRSILKASLGKGFALCTMYSI